MLNTLLKRSFPLVIILGVVACDSDTLACPAEVYFDEPVLSVTVFDSLNTNNSINEFYVSQITVNGHSLPASFHVDVEGAKGIAEGDSILCQGECVFGSLTGDYSMRFTANGYESRTVAVNAAYNKVEKEGCKTTFSKGIKVEAGVLPSSPPPAASLHPAHY